MPEEVGWSSQNVFEELVNSVGGVVFSGLCMIESSSRVLLLLPWGDKLVFIFPFPHTTRFLLSLVFCRESEDA